MNVHIAIARNGRERRVASYPYWNNAAHNLMTKLEKRQIAAMCFYSDANHVQYIAWTNNYGIHQA